MPLIELVMRVKEKVELLKEFDWYSIQNAEANTFLPYLV